MSRNQKTSRDNHSINEVVNSIANKVQVRKTFGACAINHMSGNVGFMAMSMVPVNEPFEEEEGVSWLIYTIAYGNHSEVNYNIEPLAGEPVELGMVRVKPFQLVKRNL